MNAERPHEGGAVEAGQPAVIVPADTDNHSEADLSRRCPVCGQATLNTTGGPCWRCLDAYREGLARRHAAELRLPPLDGDR